MGTENTQKDVTRSPAMIYCTLRASSSARHYDTFKEPFWIVSPFWWVPPLREIYSTRPTLQVIGIIFVVPYYKKAKSVHFIN